MNINNDTIDSCNYFSDELNETLPCQSWEFDQSEFGFTIISQVGHSILNLKKKIIIWCGHYNIVEFSVRPEMDGCNITVHLHVQFSDIIHRSWSIGGPIRPQKNPDPNRNPSSDFCHSLWLCWQLFPLHSAPMCRWNHCRRCFNVLIRS